MMIEKVGFKSFKALANVEIELGRLTVLVGANACGKSSVLDGLDVLHRLIAPRSYEPQISTGRPGKILDGDLAPTRIVTTGQAGPIQLRMVAEGNRHFSLSAHLPSVEAPHGRFSLASTWQAEDSVFEFPNDVGVARGYFQALPWSRFGPAIRLRFEPQKLAKPTIDSDVSPSVQGDGRGLASVIALLGEQRSGALEKIEADLRAIVPNARQVFTTREELSDGERKVVVKRVGLSLEPGGRVPADHLSEGTLLLLGLLTVIHAPPHPTLILLDDFDRGLHPRAQKELVERLYAILEARPDLQIVCTTHSPYALDYFKPEEVRVMGLDPKGHAFCRSLTSHPEWKRWAESMKAGEFWSFVGEDWIFGGHLAAE